MKKISIKKIIAPPAGLPIGEREKIEIVKKGKYHYATAEGILKILQYGEEEMIFAVRSGRVIFRGKTLSCTAFAGRAVCISGEIISLSFEEGKI